MEKKKRNKWIIALAILTLLAVAVACIVIFIPKNTDDVVRQTSVQAETMYLKDDEDVKMYNSMQNKIKSHSSQYSSETIIVKNLIEKLSEIMNYYSFQLMFAENNSTFQAYYHQILDGYNLANKYQSEMKDIVTEVHEKINLSSTFTEGAWINFKKSFTGYLKSYTKAIQGLSKVYADCVPNGVTHNALSILVANTANAYLEVICEKGIENHSIINSANNFIYKYVVSDSSPIAKYNYTKSLQEKVELINEFETVYGNNQTLVDVIKTIESTGIKYQPIEADQKGILTYVKTFLNGGLTA